MMKTQYFYTVGCYMISIVILLLLVVSGLNSYGQRLNSWAPDYVTVPGEGGTVTIALDISDKPDDFTLEVIYFNGIAYYPHIADFRISGDNICLTIGRNKLGCEFVGAVEIRTNAGNAYIQIYQESNSDVLGGVINVLNNYPLLSEELALISKGTMLWLGSYLAASMEPVERYFWEQKFAGESAWHVLSGETAESLFCEFQADCYFRRGAELSGGRIAYSNQVYCRQPAQQDIAGRKNITVKTPEADYGEQIHLESSRPIGYTVEAAYRWEYRYNTNEGWQVAAGEGYEWLDWYLKQNTYFRRTVTFENVSYTSDELYVRVREINGGEIALETPGAEYGKNIRINSVSYPALFSCRYTWEKREAGSSVWTIIPGVNDGAYLSELLTQGTYYRRKAMAGTDTLYSNVVFAELNPGNYVLTRTYLQPVSASDSLFVTDISYLDGFGREVQKVQVNASPAGNADLITPVRYGVQGRTEATYLPYARPGNGGTYQYTAFSPSNWSVYGAADQAYAFTATVYDNSPLDRVVKQTGPGADWHRGGKGVVTAYSFNGANQVILWRVSDAGLPVRDGFYPANTLSCVQTTDEDGNRMETFTDQWEGKERTLLSVQQNGAERCETYYIYDVTGYLRCVLSPEASANLTSAGISSDMLNKYGYVYRYDKWGRQVEKKLPGCDPVYLVYDKKDRLVLSQDGRQRAGNAAKWSYNLYDSRNRVKESGEVVISGGKSHTVLQTEADGSMNYLPQGIREPLQYLWYDAYPAEALAFTAVSNYNTDYHSLTAGLPTCIKSRILGEPDWLIATIYYDNHSREIQRVSSNLLGGISRISMAYDFVGNLVRSCESHGQTNGHHDVTESVNSYDNRGRLLTTVTTLNGGSPAQVRYTYDAVGRLTGKTYGGGSQAFTETLAYNVRGWLTEKNSDKFKLKLRYQSPVTSAVAHYNGNISEWEWQQGSRPAGMYGFSYDGLNRMLGAVACTKGASGWAVNNSGSTEQGLSYDRNGNIRTLQRTSGGGTALNYLYSYTGNQLTGLSKGGVGGSYTYDQNGNMLTDSRKILNLSYNYLNLLSEVSSGGTSKARYSYLSDGTKLRVRDGSGVNGFDYTGSLIYRKSSAGIQLDGVSFGAGRIVAGSSGYEVNYFLTDHLGSVRAIVNGATGGIKERNDYYPFGGRYDGSGSALSDNRFKYNGKEEQTTGNLKYLDYGARMYDTELGRWFGMDPMAEKYYGWSSYNYCLGNSLLFTDPNGKEVKRNKDGNISITGDDIYRYWGNLVLAVEGKTSWDNFYDALDIAADSETHRFLNLGETTDIIQSYIPKEGFLWKEGFPIFYPTANSFLVVSQKTNRYVDILDRELNRDFSYAYKLKHKIKFKSWLPDSDIRLLSAICGGYASAINPLSFPNPGAVMKDAAKEWKKADTSLREKRFLLYKKFNVIY